MLCKKMATNSEGNASLDCLSGSARTSYICLAAATSFLLFLSVSLCVHPLSKRSLSLSWNDIVVVLRNMIAFFLPTCRFPVMAIHACYVFGLVCCCANIRDGIGEHSDLGIMRTLHLRSITSQRLKYRFRTFLKVIKKQCDDTHQHTYVLCP